MSCAHIIFDVDASGTGDRSRTLAPDEDMRAARWTSTPLFDFLNVLIAINEQTGVEIPERPTTAR
ncbi:MAG: hypothetical protein R2838_19890 [Caldilineaceae bacterium]